MRHLQGMKVETDAESDNNTLPAKALRVQNQATLRVP
jgi:hypothetical protein